jgi:hypothetical protein
VPDIQDIQTYLESFACFIFRLQLPMRLWRRTAEESGKLGPQTVESNEINVKEKTLNQEVGGSIPPRLIESSI